MSSDKPIGRRLPESFDRESSTSVHYDSASYVGIVKNNKDPTRSGRLQVWIPDIGGDQNEDSNWSTVSYASPYFGATFQSDLTQNNKFEEVSHTYGMWMVPPDIGNQVLVTFVNGDLSRGYWFACINPTLSHYMVPGMAAGNKVDVPNASTGIQPSLLNDPKNPQKLPVAEFNESVNGAINENFYNNLKPIHEFQANILFNQGLDRDSVRGAITSSSQRESPSHVFGISTPGRSLHTDPAEDPDYEAKLAAGHITSDQYAVKSRKGGHQFVMDDGDDVGVDQLIRLRTAGGHQLLMNDTAKVIYVANSEGSVWMEFTESGHLHVYSASGYNLRTEGDINLHADNNINIHAGNNININSENETNIVADKLNMSATDSALLYGGKTSIGAGSTLTQTGAQVSVGASGAIKMNGATIDLNGSGSIPPVTGGKIQTNELPDTSYDDISRLWAEVPKSLTSIVPIAPAHEPWTRAAITIGPAPTKAVQSVLCPGVTPKLGTGAAYIPPPPNGNKLDKGKIKGQPVPWTTDTAFLTKVQTISSALNLNYMDMLACMNLETGGTFDPAITNSLGYTGLIQFGPPAATACGTDCNTLRNLSRVDQCDYVLKYFQYNKLAAKAPTPRLVDIYLTILWPVGVGKSLDTVIFPTGSREYRANHGFDTQGLGYITVGMVADKISQNSIAVQKALAAIPANAVGLATGGYLTDSNGNPVTFGTQVSSTQTQAQVDLGIEKAIGLGTSGSCPPEILSKATTYTPPSGIGSSPKLTQFQVKCMMAELGYFESNLVAAKQNNNGTRVGKYQIDAGYLTSSTRLYIKPDAFTQYGKTTLAHDESWTGKDQIQRQSDFMANEGLQDTIQYNEFSSNYDALLSNGGIESYDNICVVAGMLFVAHQFRSVDLAKQWRGSGNLLDANGVPGEVYFNHGRYAIDVLSSPGETGTSTTTSSIVPPNTNTTDINPTDVMTFQKSGSGTLESFLQTSSSFQTALLQAAQAYFAATGSKINVTSAYRSQESQTALYNKWIGAGGKIPDKPTAAGLTTPSKSAGSHAGVAIDSTQAAAVSRAINLAQFGLRWGGTFTSPDAVHIQLANYTPGAKIVG